MLDGHDPDVICGHLLTALYRRDEVFGLSIPRPFAWNGGDAAVLAGKMGFQAFSIDGHRVLSQAGFCDAATGAAPHAHG